MISSEQFPPDEDIWTPDRISRFWDLVASEPQLERTYFSLHNASSIIRLARLYGLNSGHVLDYGCGPGFLSAELVRQGFCTAAIDHSRESVSLTNDRLQTRSNWLGAHLPESLHHDEFDWIFSIETFEHLRDEWIPDYFMGLRRRLKPGGRLLITTPFNENLADQLVICPRCEARFHRWGHLRSVSASDLARLVQSFGFQIELCQGVDLNKTEVIEKRFWSSLLRASQVYGSLAKNQDFLGVLRRWMTKRLLGGRPSQSSLVLVASKRPSL